MGRDRYVGTTIEVEISLCNINHPRPLLAINQNHIDNEEKLASIPLLIIGALLTVGLVISCGDTKTVSSNEVTAVECQNLRKRLNAELSVDTTVYAFVQSVSRVVNQAWPDLRKRCSGSTTAMEDRSQAAVCLLRSHPHIDTASVTSTGHGVRIYDSTEKRWYNILVR